MERCIQSRHYCVETQLIQFAFYLFLFYVRMNKKLFAAFTAASVVAMSLAPVANVSVSANSAENTQAYTWAFDKGLTTMPTFGQFMFENAISREQAARFLVQGAKALGIELAKADQTCDYKDLGSADQTLVDFINQGCELGIFKAQADFNPKTLLTREQAELVVARIVYGFDEVMSYAKDGNMTEYAAARELLMADEIVKFQIAGQSAVKRGHLLLMLYRLADNTNTNPSTPSTGNVVVSGHAEVSLVSSAGTVMIPKNAVSKKVGTIKITAGKDGATVSSVVITKSGLGSNNVEVQLVGEGIVTDARRVNSSNEASVRFAPALRLEAGKSAEFDVLVTNTDDSENAVRTFAVTALNVANGTAGGMPVTLGTTHTTSYKVSEVTVSSFTTPSSLKAGEANKTVATVSLQAARDAKVEGFILTRKAGADLTKAFANVKAYFNGKEVGKVALTSEKIIVSDLNIERIAGETAQVELKADGIWIGAAETVKLAIDAKSDVKAIEKATNEVMAASNDNIGVEKTINLNAVKLSLEKLTKKDETVAPGTSSVVLFEAKVRSDVEFDISDYALKLTAAGTPAELKNSISNGEVSVYINGDKYDLDPTSAAYDAGRGFVFNKSSDRFLVGPGRDAVIKVTASFKSTAELNKAYRFTLTLVKGKNVSNSNETDLNTSIAGNTVTVNNGTYTISKPTIATNKTVVEGTEAEMLNFKLRAASEAQTLTEVKVKATYDASNKFKDFADKVALYRNGDQVKEFTSETDLDVTELTFNDLSAALDKDVDTNFVVKVTLKSAEVANLGKKAKLEIPASGIKVVKANNNTVATSTTSTLPISNNTDGYQISSVTPEVAVPAQDGKFTTLSFKNSSNYDVKIEKVEVEMTRNAVNGSYLQWGGTAKLLDAINGSEIAGGTINVPGLGEFTVTAPFTVGAGEETRVVELVDNNNSISANDYQLTVKKVTYKYVDRTDGTESVSLVETYNVSK